MRELRVGSSDCLFVGDGGSDELRGARDIGITAVMITGHIARAFPERIAERRENADFVIESLDELVPGC
jgi:putative hydrolase of the HAD superfamily